MFLHKAQQTGGYRDLPRRSFLGDFDDIAVR